MSCKAPLEVWLQIRSGRHLWLATRSCQQGGPSEPRPSFQAMAIPSSQLKKGSTVGSEIQCRGGRRWRETGLWPYSPQLGIYGPRQSLIALPSIPNPKQGRE